MEIRIREQARGTRIILSEECHKRRLLLHQLIHIAESNGFKEISLPSIEPAFIYSNKAGNQILNQMYSFKDKKERDLCLRPEVTATIQLIADQHFFKNKKNVKLWYFEKCWRYERPQLGRYREFWQFGCEILNNHDQNALLPIAEAMVRLKTNDYVVNASVKRGLDYYIEDGFEIECPQLGAQKQVCGGGAYKQGIGFAIGFDRLILVK